MNEQFRERMKRCVGKTVEAVVYDWETKVLRVEFIGDEAMELKSDTDGTLMIGWRRMRGGGIMRRGSMNE